MYKQLGVVSRGLLVAAGILVYAGSAWATTTNNCPNSLTPSPVNVSNGTNTNAVTIPNVSGGTPPNDLASLGAAGCTAVDLYLSNFNNSSFTGTGANGAETLAGTYMAETPAGTSNNPLTSPDVLLFSTVNGAASGTGTAADGTPNDGNNNWVVTKNLTPIADQINYNVGSSGNNPSEAISGVVLTVYEPYVDNSNTGSVTVYVCEGTQTGVITTAGACTGTFVTQTLTIPTATVAATQSIDVLLPSLPSAFDITTEIDLANQGGTGKFAGIDAFSEELDETTGTSSATPEPSTFVLLGAALAGVGLLRRRGRRA